MDKKCHKTDEPSPALSNDCIEAYQCRSAIDAVMIFYLSLMLRGGMDTLPPHASRQCSNAIVGSIPWLVN